MTHPNGAAADLVARASSRLHTHRIGRAIRAFDVVGSTNELALKWAEEGAPDGAVVYAELQKQGRGRMGRPWVARGGINLTFSIVLRPSLPTDRWGMITIAAGVAVAEAVDAVTEPVRSQIKWPNDVLLEGRKCCGMLLETRGSGSDTEASRAVVLGIGLNVNQDSFPPDLEERATSLLLTTGRPASRPDLLADLLGRLEDAFDELADGDSGLRRRYMARMRDLNEPIELRFGGQSAGKCAAGGGVGQPGTARDTAGHGGSMRGVAAGLHESGGLILATDEGMKVYHAGEVTRST